MRRLTILMIEMEQPEGLTSRKLVAETMKHNVLTAYTAEEGLALLREDKIHLVLVHSLLPGGAEDCMRQIKQIAPDTPILQIIPNVEELEKSSDQQQRSPLADEAFLSNELGRFYNYLDHLSEKVLGEIPNRHSETKIVPSREGVA